MPSLVFHTEYEGGDIGEKIHNPLYRFYVFFVKILTIKSRMNHQRKHVIVYI